jgi:hypothetical protein
MSLETLLADKKSVIVQQWLDVTLQSYPEESQTFFKKKDQFGNPVGHTLSEGLAATYDALLEDAGKEVLSKVLDGIIRIRAIQEFSASQAVRFLFDLKGVVRAELGEKIYEDGLRGQWARFETRIDKVALLGFDIYCGCRQSIFDIRVDAVKRHTSRLLKKAGLVYEFPEAGSGQTDLQEGITNLDNG